MKAMPELLRFLDLHGCIVTVDALGCQQEVATPIRSQGADYVVAVKANQGHLWEDLTCSRKPKPRDGRRRRMTVSD